MSISDSLLSSIKERLSVSSVVRSRIDLKQKVSVCPFHEEKTPSFTISDSKGFYHCFGCGAHGDVIDFVKKYEGVSFRAAVQILCSESGIPFNEDINIQTSGNINVSDIFGVNYKVAMIHQRELKSDAGAIAYLKNRGVTGIQAKLFCLGYASGLDTIHQSFKGSRVSDEMLNAAGVTCTIVEGELMDFFVGRIVMPIWDNRGHIPGFTSRSITDDRGPKTLHTRGGIAFQKSDHFYGLKQATEAIKRHKKVIVVEGPFDVLAVSRTVSTAVIGLMGSSLSTAGALMLNSMANEVIFVFDGDKAGDRGAWSALEKLIKFVSSGDLLVRFGSMPRGTDPDSYISNGHNMKRVLAEASTYPECFVAQDS